MVLANPTLGWYYIFIVTICLVAAIQNVYQQIISPNGNGINSFEADVDYLPCSRVCFRRTAKCLRVLSNQPGVLSHNYLSTLVP